MRCSLPSSQWTCRRRHRRIASTATTPRTTPTGSSSAVHQQVTRERAFRPAWIVLPVPQNPARLIFILSSNSSPSIAHGVRGVARPGPTVVGSPVRAWNKKRAPLVVCNMRPLRLSYAFSLLTLLPLFPIQGQTPVVSAGNAALSAYPLRGDLVAGPYRVGFRRLFRFDASRTWQTPRDFT